VPNPRPRQVLAVALSHDGAVALTGSADATARLWSTSTGRLMHVLKDKERRSPVSSVGSVCACRLPSNPPRRRLLGRFVWTSASRLALTVFNESVAIWDVDSGEFLYSLAGNGGHITSLAADGRWIVTGSKDALVRVWDMETGRLLQAMSGHTDCVTHVAMADGCTTALSKSEDGSTRVWDLLSLQAPGRDEGAQNSSTAEVTVLALRPDGKFLLVGDVDGLIRSVDLATAERVAFEGHRGAVLSLNYSPDQTMFVSGGRDKAVRVWDLSTRQLKWLIRSHFEAVQCCVFTPDQGRIVSASLDETVKVFHNSSGKLVHSMNKNSGPCMSVQVHGKLALVGAVGPQQACKVWNVEDGKLVKTFDPVSDVLAVAWQADGKRCVSGSLDGSTKVWDFASGACLFVVAARSDVCAVKFGKTLGFTSLRCGETFAWSLDAGRRVDGAGDAAWTEDLQAGARGACTLWQQAQTVGLCDAEHVGWTLDLGAGCVIGTASRFVFKSGCLFGVWEFAPS
jgi:WD40 repeat protein